jgi:glyoxylase-like metal-dependent hydrolase (beta-lactamase superfamily II)/rhodanese-related sulfurtransferase
MIFRQLFDPETSTYTYLLADASSREAILIDPVREQVERDAAQLDDLGLTLVATVETHVHADHVTGAWLLKQRYGSDIVVPYTSGVTGADCLVREGDTIRFGRHSIEVRLTPGHTDGCASYVCSDGSRVFTGDAVLIRGSGRTDFQQGDARKLYRSVWDQIFTLPDETLIYPGHDYKGRTVSTVAEEKRLNPRLGQQNTEDDFVRIMGDLKLAHPKKIDVAVPANLNLGRFGDEAVDAGPEAPWAPVRRSAVGAPHVDPDWVAATLGKFRVIDVRQPEEFEGELGHIEGAELVPLATVEAAMKGWDRSEPLVLICRSSGRSDRAALLLEAAGFQRVASMVGGMNLWNERRFAVAAK